MAHDAGRLPGGALVRIRGSRWVVADVTAHRDCATLRVVGNGTDNAGDRRTFLLPFDRARTLPPPRLVTCSRRRWARAVARLMSRTTPCGGLSSAAAARIRILPYQLAPAIAMLGHGRMRVIIADEVGLGKTIQAGLVLAELAARDTAVRVLIVTPAGLRDQWREELSVRYAVDATVADSSWLPAAARELPPGVNPWSIPGVFITSWDLVKRPEVLRPLEDVAWDLVVMDEVHGAGLGTARLQAARALADRARRLLLLTATPPDGDPLLIETLAGLGAAGQQAAMTIFRRARTGVDAGADRRTKVVTVRPSPAERRMHRLLARYASLLWHDGGRAGETARRLLSVLLQKRALSSATSLARTLQRRLELLSDKAAADGIQQLLPMWDEDLLPDAVDDTLAGVAGLDDVGAERRLLEELLDAAERAGRSESKLAFVRRLLRRAREPVIVFTEYRDTLAHLARAIAASRDVLVLHGGMSLDERRDVRQRFNAGGAVLVATDAAAEGLNLHHRCRAVVHFELPWNPSRLEQRTGRVDRIGQSRTVHEMLLVARHTCERVVLAPLALRLRRAGSGADRQRLLALSESQIAQVILGGGQLACGSPLREQRFETLDLDAEVRDEARRIATIRRLPRDHHPTPPQCVVARGAVRRWLLAVVEVAVEDRHGTRQHAEVLPLRVECDPFFLDAQAAEVLRNRLPSLAARTIAAASHRAVVRCAGVLEAQQQRDLSLARRITSGPAGAVQRALFDRRAVTAADHASEVRVALLDACEDRAESFDRDGLRTVIRVVALRPLATP